MPDAVLQDPSAMAAEISALRALADEQAAVIERLTERVAELERMLGMNSRNSGRPPSSDGLGKPRAAKRNPKGSRRPGGQPGRRGVTLRRSSSPDAVEDRFPDACGGCGRALDPESSVRFASRQVHDLPEPSPLVVTEFRAHSCRCGSCGATTTAGFPDGVSGPVQYGPRLAAAILYLSAGQLVPLERLRQTLADLFGVRLSHGTVSAVLGRGADAFEGLWRTIREMVRTAPVKHMDETGMRVEGALGWFHVACTRRLSCFWLGDGRGDVMSDAEGVAVHDCWGPYFKIAGIESALCSAYVAFRLMLR